MRIYVQTVRFDTIDILVWIFHVYRHIKHIHGRRINHRIELNVERFRVALTTRTCFISIFVAASQFTASSLVHSMNNIRYVQQQRRQQ